MEMVAADSIALILMTAVAEGIILRIYAHTVRFMTIVTLHALLIHFTLEKGTPDINLIADLSVRKI